jgi:hypothetical protein
MSAERKKAEKKPVLKVEPKKRVEPTPVPKVEPKKRAVVKPVIVEPVKPVIAEPTEKVKRSENKYVRIAYDAKPEEKKEFSEKVQKGELKLACYAVDGDKAYYYYLVIKK